ncbi:fructose-specific PTS transporter subunit EIIC [Streptomyces sp. NPDC093111]|uniref:fructose-specific PTS transporter subunit EIIC n=1 Tax=Streptomyces sp. NPDC093111 TaxID=3154978 RepID=UPI00342CDB96
MPSPHTPRPGRTPSGPDREATAETPAETPGAATGAAPALRLVAITACPTGIAHTYMAAEKLQQAADAAGHSIKVETQGSIGAENVLTAADVAAADGVVIAADKDIDLGRFGGKRIVVASVADGIHRPLELMERTRTAPVSGTTGPSAAPAGGGRERGVVYKALMNGVSYMIPFVVVGGLLIAIALALGGTPQAEGGLVIPDGSPWKHVFDIGVIGFQLMVPILSGYIAYAIGDRPALVPGMIGGWIANTGALYGSESGAGFIGAIVTGFLAGYLVLGIKKVPVPKFAQPIMPIIVIPIVATTTLGMFFIYALGKPIAGVFGALTSFLSGLTGGSAALLGVVIGLMLAFDMGGPVNKTAFLFATGLIAEGNLQVMGMFAAGACVPACGMGLATLIRRRLFDEQQREAGLAALFMGFFGIAEGAIPFAAARPAQVIPANMLGSAVACGLGGAFAVTGAVPHGGPIVALMGAIGGVPLFFLAAGIGTVVTAVTAVGLLELSDRRAAGRTTARATGRPTGLTAGLTEDSSFLLSPVPAPAFAAASVSASAPMAAAAAAPQATLPAQVFAEAAVEPSTRSALGGALTRDTVTTSLAAHDKPAALRELADLLGRSGCVTDPGALVRAAERREELSTTALGDGIAIPHAKTDAVERPVVGYARSETGIDWGAPDDIPVRDLFMIAVPERMAGDEHLRLLAALARKLADPGFRARLSAATTTDRTLTVLEDVA